MEDFLKLLDVKDFGITIVVAMITALMGVLTSVLAIIKRKTDAISEKQVDEMVNVIKEKNEKEKIQNIINVIDKIPQGLSVDEFFEKLRVSLIDIEIKKMIRHPKMRK